MANITMMLFMSMGTRGKKLTLIPEGLADDLIASGLVLVGVFGRAGLLDLIVVVLDVSAVLIERSHLDLLFNGREIDARHGILCCQPSTGDGKRVRYSWRRGGCSGYGR